MKKNIRILFIGNSLTYYNFLPECVRRLFEVIDVNADCVMLTTGGKCLDYHADQKCVKYNILYGHYDYVVLQGRAGGFDREKFLDGGRRINEWIKQAGSEVILYNVWSLKGRRKSQAELNEGNDALAAEIGAKIAPAGNVWHQCERIHGIPELYREDGNHPMPAGTYVNSAAIFYTITERERALRLDEGGVFEDYGLTLDQAQKIHKIACRQSAEKNA